MKPLRGGAGKGIREPAPDAAEQTRQTLLLGHLFDGRDEDVPVTVLDVGAGAAETVAFLSRYRCRVHFADFYEAPALQVAPGDDPAAHYAQVFAELCAFDADIRFDVCLLWDFLNYLPVPALKAFSAALAPHLHHRTLGHGFGAFKATAPGVNRDAPATTLRYGISAPDRLVVRPRTAGLSASYAHSRTVLADAFHCFEVTRGTLLQQGAMELLLQAR